MIVIPFGFVSGAAVPPVPAADLLLNDFPNASGAYSLRKLDKNYSGYAIKVRESGSGTLADIGFDSNGDLDIAALTAHTTTNNGAVSIWYDQSGKGRNLQGSVLAVAEWPLIVSAGVINTVNGKPSIYFDGSLYHMDVIDWVGKSTQTYFSTGQIEAKTDAIIAYTTGGYYYTMIDGSASSADQLVGQQVTIG